MDQEQTGMNILELGSPLREGAELSENQEQDIPVNTSELTGAFNRFNRLSTELEKTYQSLESKVDELRTKLVDSGDQRHKDLAKKERQIDRLSDLIEILPSGIVVLDKTSRVCQVNHQASQLLGEPLVGSSWSGVVARIAVPEVRAGFELKLRDGRILSLMSRQLASTGERVILVTEVTSIHENQERVSRDKKLAALGEMAASLAHQIRTPLSSAMLYMSQLSLSKLPQSERARMAEKVQARLSHMSSLTDSMLKFVRGAKPEARMMSLNSLIEKTENLVRMPAHQAGASVKFTDVDPSLMIHGDIESLAGALANLVLNAIENNNGNPWVCVETKALNQTQIEIKVLDNGPGIAMQHLDKVFDPFFTTRVQGTGLGLAVVAMTVTAHDGNVSVKNRDTGGAEFAIKLPAVNTQAAVGVFPTGLPITKNEVTREVA